MRILVLAQYFFPDMGGGSTRASNVVRGLLSKDCEVIVVTAFPHYPNGQIAKKYKCKAIKPEIIWGAKVFRVWIAPLPHKNALTRIVLHFCYCVSSLFALPFVGKVDVIWAANPNLFSFFPSLVYSFVNRLHFIRNIDDLWPEVFYELGYVKSIFAKKILNFLAWISYVVPIAVTPISEGYKQHLVSKYGISSEKIHVIEVGVNNIKSKKSSAQLDNRFIVMYSGVLGLGYDFDVVLDAAKLLEKNDDIVFIIRGVGEKAVVLKQTITDHRLNNVVLETSFLPQEKLDFLLNSADVFILPMANLNFVEQGLPTKVFEYQSYGKPILCISDGEPARYVKSTKSGLVVRPNDSIGVAESIIRFYTDKKFGAELGKNGKNYILNFLTAQKIGERMYLLFKSYH